MNQRELLSVLDLQVNDKKEFQNINKYNYVRFLNLSPSRGSSFKIRFKLRNFIFRYQLGSTISTDYKFRIDFNEILEITTESQSTDPLTNSLVLEFGYDPSLPEFL